VPPRVKTAAWRFHPSYLYVKLLPSSIMLPAASLPGLPWLANALGTQPYKATAIRDNTANKGAYPTSNPHSSKYRVVSGVSTTELRIRGQPVYFRPMTWKPWMFFAVALAGWIDRQQQDAIEYRPVEDLLHGEAALGEGKTIAYNTGRCKIPYTAHSRGRRERHETDLRHVEGRQARIRIYGTDQEGDEVICRPEKR